MSADRFFLDRDSSGHWYLIPAANREDWDFWSNLDEDDERSWDPPDFARRIAGSPSWVTFESPVDEVSGG